MRKGSLVVNNGWVGIYALSSLITNTQFKLGRRIVAALPHPPSTDGTIDNNWIPTASRYYIDTIIIFIMLPKFSPAVLCSVLLFSGSVIPSSAAAYDTDTGDDNGLLLVLIKGLVDNNDVFSGVVVDVVTTIPPPLRF